MTTRTIQNPSRFQINEETNQNTYWGFDQEWYTTKWKRLSGCGPTTAANIISYLDRTRAGADSGHLPLMKSSCQSLMDEVWKYVTPTLSGISSTKLFYDDVLNYAQAKSINLTLEVIDIPKDRLLRPEFLTILSFLDEALRRDTPVAFLNLNNGDEKQLDSWHWVTIVSVEYAEDGSTALIEILDEGKIKKINLAQWFQTTTLGGGFVSFNQQ